MVDSPEVSTRFLWDWRRLVAESIARDYVGGLREVANENGLALWLENYGHWGFPSEFLLYGSMTDQVGGEFGAAEVAEAVERRHAVERGQPCGTLHTVEIAARTVVDQVGGDFGGKGRAFRAQHLGRRKPPQFRCHPVGQCAQLEQAGRDIDGGKGPLARGLRQRNQPVGSLAVEQRLLGQCTGSDETDNGARDQRLRSAALLRLFGRFDLLGDGNAMAGTDQPGEIGFGGMDGHAAHRHRCAAMVAARGQRDIECRRRRLRIVEEQLEEIAHPVEQQAIARLRLERVILRHHRRHRGARGRGAVGVGHDAALPQRRGEARGRRTPSKPLARGSVSG